MERRGIASSSFEFWPTRMNPIRPLLFTAVLLWTAIQAAAHEYCLRELVNISCAPEEVIMMTSAEYGRMRGGRCIKAEAGPIGCLTDVIPQLDELCSGRQHCTFPVANLLQHKPCQDDFTPYLETHHTCLTVSPSRCSSPEGFIHLTDQDGFLPLSIHASRCPWKIKVDAMQTLRLTLYQFGQRKLQPEMQLCPWSVVFEDGGKPMDHPLCHVASRETVLYTSKSNSVSVRVSYKQNVVLPVAFFLKYEAIGCPQLKVPGSATVKLEGTKATVKCNQTEETWFLACSERRWHGEIGNCSKIQTNDVALTDSMPNASRVTSLPFGFLIAVVIGVLLGVIIGAIPLALVYVCLKRKWRRQAPSCYIAEDPYYPGVQQTFVESNAVSVYPALLKRGVAAAHHPTNAPSPKRGCDGTGSGFRTDVQCCYGCTEPFAYNTATPGHPRDKPVDSGSRRQLECCRVLECPDVMAHVVSLQGGVQQSPAVPASSVVAGKTSSGHEHVYESAGFGRTRLAGLPLAESIPGDFVPYYGTEAVHCYTPAKLDQAKQTSDNLTEISEDHRITTQPL